MKIGEIGVIVINFALLYWMIIMGKKKGDNWKSLWPVAASWLLVLIQVIVEGYRTLMLPAYLTPLVLTIYYLIRRKKKARKPVILALQLVLLTLFLTVSVLPVYFFPVFSFAKPTGSYSVGTTLYEWVDEQRSEPYSTNPNDRRELVVQIWYPAENVQGSKPTRYIYDNSKDVKAALAKWKNFPAFTLDQLGVIRTHAFADAVLSKAEPEYPVLLFSHGMRGVRTQNTFEVEELASHGYIVVGIDHTYDAGATVFPGGRTIVQQTSANVTTDYKVSDQHISLWNDDSAFVLDQLEKLNQHDADDRWTGRMDLNRIGMFGHSYGGANAYQMLLKDSRIKAAIDMDGGLFGEKRASATAGEGARKPFLLMNAAVTVDRNQLLDVLSKYPAEKIKGWTGQTPDELKGGFDLNLKRWQESVVGGGLSLVIPHGSHYSFTDLTLYSSLFRAKGENAQEVHEVINKFSLAFFNQYLLGEDSSVLDSLKGQYKEVNFKRND
jgi:predicted dienelactone hydrolase